MSKLRILYNKKPVPDSKILKDVVGDGGDGGKVEFSVMVMGGAAAALKRGGSEELEVEPRSVEKGFGIGEGKKVLETEEFWVDLRGYLVQRLKDEGEGEKVCGTFRRAIQGER